MSVVEGIGPSEDAGDSAEAIVEYVERQGGGCFVSEIRAALLASAERLEVELTHLDAAGRVVVRHHFCADPHFENDDLRTIALVEAGNEEPFASAEASCERLWQEWMTNFLASHRCS